MNLAARMARVSTSPTMQVLQEADRLRAKGVDVVDFGAGEPDFPTPEAVKAAARTAIDENFTKYTPLPGVSELKRAIAGRYEADYGVRYSEAEVIVTAGGKQALYNAALALFGAGDEVLTHAPCWPTLPEQIKLADATPVLVRTDADAGFAIRAQPFIEALTPRTKGIILNSPCNPTGAVMPEAEMRALAEAVAPRDVWMIVDLCYERLIYEEVAHNLPGVLSTRLRDRTVLCGSTSKAYAMTGWRCGWAVGPAQVIAACGAIQSHSTSNVSSISQKAAIEALTGSQRSVTAMLDEYRVRRDQVCTWLAEEPRLRCVKPAGAFYLFIDVTRLLSADGLRSSAEFAQALLDDARVALTPGEAFDAPGFVRVSYATSLDRLREGFTRMFAFIRAHDGLEVGSKRLEGRRKTLLSDPPTPDS